MDNSIEKASQSIESKTYQGKEVRLCSDGKYRWVYEMNLLKNPTIFLTVLKVMMISVGIVWLFGLVIGLGNMSLDYFLFWTKLTGIMIGIFFVLTIIGVLITAARRWWVLWPKVLRGWALACWLRRKRRAPPYLPTCDVSKLAVDSI